MREWIVTNGLGGYASLTHKNTNTSKFHGLLVSSLNPPTERWLFVSNVIDKIQQDNKDISLENFRKGFNFDYFPNFVYRKDNLDIKKTVFMQQGKNTTILRYEIKNTEPVTLIHMPIINSRHFYDVNSKRYLSFNQETKDSTLFLKPDNNKKTLKIIFKNSVYSNRKYWETLYYEKDRNRNDSWIDNAIHIGYFYKHFKKPCTYYIVLTTEKDFNINPERIYFEEKKRKQKIINNSNLSKKFARLIVSSDNFIVKKNNGKSIIAGYPWFGDWGRDTLISLPGLTLVTGRFNDAKNILTTFSKYCRNGLVPNVFSDRDSKASYNTVDASLWYIDRVYQYLKYTNDTTFLKKIWKTLVEIIDSYKNGTDFDIHMDKDFLISHEPGLTWMDVKIDDYHSTPRNNKAVEIQALWYNALKIMSVLSKKLGKKDIYDNLSKKVKESFNNQYDKLYDVIDKKDISLRPNMIFLVSLDFTMIDNFIQKKIVEKIQKNLLTVFGIRTLNPKDPSYKGHLIGPYNKDSAYHNGTVWPWLLGPFVKSYVKIHDNNESYRIKAYTEFIKPMFLVFGDKWDGSINEIFDGDPVYDPRGCITQAWSVAEILRTIVEDIEDVKPNYEKNFLLHKISI